jgi:hypothetical protein
MRQLVLSFFLSLWAFGPARAQSALLQRRVQLTVANQPLGEVLREVSRRSGVNFSYSNTIIPLHSPVTLRTTGPQSVESVLTKLCRSQGLSWQLVDGQVVLWRTAAGLPPQLAAAAKAGGSSRRATANAPRHTGGTSGAATGQPPRPSTTLSTAASGSKSEQKTPPAVTQRKAKRLSSVVVGPTRTRLAATKRAPSQLENRAPNANKPAAAREKTTTSAKPRASADTVVAIAPAPDSAQAVAATHRALLPSLQQKARQAAQTLARAARQVGKQAAGSIEPLKSRLVRASSGLSNHDTLPAARSLPAPVHSSDYYQRQAQVTFVSPLGTNWLRSGRTSNAYSLNVLAGYAAGVRRLEIGGLVNVVRDTVRGVQLAGLANVVGTATQGFQAAGLANI